MPNSTPLTLSQAKVRVNEGKNIMTPLRSDAKKLFDATSYQGILSGNALEKRVVPDKPHYENFWNNISKQDKIYLNEAKTPQEKYNRYAEIDPGFLECNENNYYAHYHPIGFAHEQHLAQNNANVHIYFIGSGSIDDLTVRLKKALE